MDCTLREMDLTSRKWIVPQGNGSYIMEMVVHQGYGSCIKGNGSYLQGNGSHRVCVVPPWKIIITDGKELGQQSESQARLTSAMFVFCFDLYRVLFE